MAAFGSVTVCASPHFLRLTLHFRKCREFLPETGSRATGSSASYYVLDIAYIIVFLGSLFCREFAGFTELAESTICSQRKPSSFRCSAQPAGSRGVRRI